MAGDVATVHQALDNADASPRIFKIDNGGKSFFERRVVFEFFASFRARCS
jgi:hypothetical protein